MDHIAKSHGSRETADTAIQQLCDRVLTICANPQNSVIIFAHSYGAHITHEALKPETCNLHRHQLDVYTFGTVDPIPRNIGVTVMNYVFDSDLASLVGSAMLGNSPMFLHYNIHRRLQTGGNVDYAIRVQALEELHQCLSPWNNAFGASNQELAETTRKFQSYFFNGQEGLGRGMEDPYFLERHHLYTTVFQDYDVQFETREPVEESEGLLASIAGAFASHLFASYIPVVERLAANLGVGAGDEGEEAA